MFNTECRYKIHWEITDLCNLKCPMCPRTDILNRCRPVKEIQNSQFSLEDVMKYFPDSFLKKIKRIDFCGNFGDPCMARDFYNICEFLVKKYNITIMASTNGSMRDPSWWKKLGTLLAGTDSWFEFHIDGLSDTNHLYRIGANWERVVANTQAFISGGARADWHYILFRHNQHQLDEARNQASQMGFKHFVPTDSGRFPPDGKYRYMHPDGNLRDLEQATISIAHEKADSAIIDNPQKTPSQSLTTVNGITCKSASKNRFFLDSRGYITPCCWVSNRDIEKPGDMLKTVALITRDIDDFNIHSRPIEEILTDQLFITVFPDLWKSDDLATCRKKCGKKHRNVKHKILL